MICLASLEIDHVNCVSSFLFHFIWGISQTVRVHENSCFWLFHVFFCFFFFFVLIRVNFKGFKCSDCLNHSLPLIIISLSDLTLKSISKIAFYYGFIFHWHRHKEMIVKCCTVAKAARLHLNWVFSWPSFFYSRLFRFSSRFGKLLNAWFHFECWSMPCDRYKYNSVSYKF